MKKMGHDEKLSRLLGSSFDCSCGSHHVVPTDHLVFDSEAFARVPSIVNKITDGRNCLLVADTRTYGAAGIEVEKILQSGGLKTARLILPDLHGESPQADEQTRDLILEEAENVDVYIAVGSGVINDLVKWASFQRKKPYIVVATAASMNGYASANVAATIDGLKVLLYAEAPKAVLVKPEVILDAPFEMTTSGLGDVLAKPVSSADWKLNKILFQDYYCEFSVDLLKDLEPVYLENPVQIKNREMQGFEALFKALFFSSIAMTVTGTSAPASGGEHLISHTLDMLAGRDDVQHDLHGRQVGVSTILMAALYEKVLSIEHPKFYTPPHTINSDFWGVLAPTVLPEYQKKLPKLKQAAEQLSQAGKWEELKASIKPNLIPALKIKNCLKQAGGAHRFCDIRFNQKPLTRETFVSVVHNASQMRDRFTILDLAILLKIIPGEIDQIISDWVTV